MKIVGHTKYGYLIEASPRELSEIAGNSALDAHAGLSSYGRSQYSHEIGMTFNISPTWAHLKDILQNEDRRKQIAESLRASATLIEHTPSPITLPEPEQQPEA